MKIPTSKPLFFCLTGLLAMFLSLTNAVFAARDSDLIAKPNTTATLTPTVDKNEKLSTPELIERDFAEGNITAEQRFLYLNYALNDPKNLPPQYRSKVAWEGTMLAIELSEEEQKLRKNGKFTSFLAQNLPNLANSVCGYVTEPLDEFIETEHFHIEYNIIRDAQGDPVLRDGKTIPDIKDGSELTNVVISEFITLETYANALEAAYQKEATEYGWAAPPLLLGRDRYFVQIPTDMGGDKSAVRDVGTETGPAPDDPSTPLDDETGNNPNTSWPDGDAYVSCMLLNNNFPQWNTKDAAVTDSILVYLQQTAMHEFHHMIQFGYGAIPGTDSNFIEGGAQWLGSYAYGSVIHLPFDPSDPTNTATNRVPPWPQFEKSMGAYPDADKLEYSYWHVFQGLTERYGTGTKPLPPSSSNPAAGRMVIPIALQRRRNILDVPTGFRQHTALSLMWG
jgi:hypothetical protein